jgi:hypothetical protein
MIVKGKDFPSLVADSKQVGPSLARKKKAAIAGNANFTVQDERQRGRAVRFLQMFDDKATRRESAWGLRYEELYEEELAKGNTPQEAHRLAVKYTVIEETHPSTQIHPYKKRGARTVKNAIKEWIRLHKLPQEKFFS